MAITTEQRTQILQLCQAMFNAAPGAAYLSNFSTIVGDGATISDLANMLDDTAAFNGPALYPNYLSANEFATKFIDNFVGSLVSAEANAWAVAQVEARLANGESRGDVMWWAAQALDGVPADEPTWGAAAQAFDNKIEVSEYYSVTQGGSALDLGTLQGVTVNITDDPASVDAAIAAVDNGVLPSTGLTYSLTDGIDQINGTGNDDVINGFIDDTGTADQSTMQVFDVIDGAAGNDVMNILIPASISTQSMGQVSNVETLNFNTFGSGEDFSIDMGLVSDVTELNVNIGQADGSSDVYLYSANLQLDSLNVSGKSTPDDTTDLWFYMNTSDATEVGIQEINVSNIGGYVSWFEVDNLTNIPVLNLENMGRTSDSDFSLEVLDSVATGTADTLVVNMNNAGTMNYTDGTNTVDIYLDNQTADGDIYESVEIDVMGDNGLYLNDSDGLETVTLTGTGDLALWFSDTDTLSTYDGSMHSGDLTSTIDSTVDATVTLGDGDHWFGITANTNGETTDTMYSVTTGSGSTWLRADDFGGTNDVSDFTVDLGAGNDWFDLWVQAKYDVTLGEGDDVLRLFAVGDLGSNTTDAVDGGAGTDTVLLDAADLSDTAAMDALSGFEQLLADSSGTYDMDNLAGITNLISGGINDSVYGPRWWWDPAVSVDTWNATSNVAVNFINVEAGTDLTLNADNSIAVSYALADDTATDDAVNVALGNMDDGTFDDVVVAALDLSGIETINFSSISHALTSTTDTVDSNVITNLVAADATTITISGDGDFALTNLGGAVTDTTAALTILDASGLSGDFTMGEASDTTNGLQFTGAQGVDTYFGTINGDTVNAGASNDAITLGAGGNADTLIYEADDALVGAVADTLETITGFVTGEDTIDLGAFDFTASTSALGNKGNINATILALTDESAAISNFFTVTAVQRAVAVSSDGTDVLVMVDVNNDGHLNVDTDLVIELTGATAVALGDFGF